MDDKTLIMTEYDIKLSLGHVLIDGGNGRLLVDTGSPLSFHESGRIILCGESFSVPTSLPGADADYVSEKVHDRVGGLVGTDILGHFGFKFDVPAGKLAFGPSIEGMRRLPSRTVMGYLLMEMTVNGRTAQVLLDSGAPVSYVSPSLTEGLAPVDHVVDFNPMVPGDTFETDVFEFPASLAGKDFVMRAGHLPPLLEMQVNVLGVQGVFGMEILGRFPLAVVDGGTWV